MKTSFFKNLLFKIVPNILLVQ